MYCARSSVELASLMDGELPREHIAELNRHLADCAACRRGLRLLKQAASLVGALARVSGPADLRARVARKAAQPRAVAALTCAGVREMLDDYAHGHLAQDQADSVEAHLAACGACSRELALVEQSAGLLQTLTKVEPPARIRREVARRSRPAHTRPAWRGMIATAGVAVAAGVVMLALRMPGSQPATTATERPLPAASAVTTAPAPTPQAAQGAERSVAPVASGLPAEATSRQYSAAPTARKAMPAPVGGWSALARGSASEPTTRGPAASGVEAPIPTVMRPERGRAAETVAAVATTVAHAGIGYAEPAVRPEPGVQTTAGSTSGEVREAVAAAMVPAGTGPLSEVRRALREQSRTEPPTLKPRHERDRFSSGPIPKWGF